MTPVILRKSLLFSVALFLLALAYGTTYYGMFSFFIVQEAFAVAAVLVIAPSMALSGISYFWKRYAPLLVYRKALGQIGLLFGLLHVAMAMLNNGVAYRAYTLDSVYDVSMVAGYLAVLLFVLMPFYSSVRTTRRIGGAKVRLALRYLGYGGYVFVLVHATLLLWDDWMLWVATPSPILPPPTLVACVIGGLVLCLRMTLFFAQQKKKLVHK